MQLDGKKIEEKTAEGAVLTTIASFISKAASIIFYVVALRLVEQREAGLFFLAVALAYTTLTVIDFGISSVVQRYVPFWMGKKEHQPVKQLIFSAFSAAGVLSIIAVLFLLVFQNNIAALYNSESLKIMPFVALLVILFYFQNILFNALQGLAKFTEVNTVTTFQNIIKIILMFLAVNFLGPTAFSLLASFALTLLAGSLLLLFFLLRSLRPFSFLLLEKEKLPELASFAWPSYALNYSNFATDWLPTLMLGHFSSLEAVAAYNAMLALANTLPPLMITPISTVIVPMLSMLHGSDKNKFSKLSAHATRWTVFITLPAVILFLFFAKDLAGLLFPNYISYYQIAYILVPALSFAMISRTYVYALIAGGDMKSVFNISILTLAISLLLNMLVLFFGLWGAVVAKAYSALTKEALSVYFAKKKLGLYLHPLTLRALIAGAAMALALFFLNSMNIPAIAIPEISISYLRWISIAILSFSGLCVYGLALYILKGFEDRDFYIAKQMAERVLGKMKERVSMTKLPWHLKKQKINK